MKTSLFDWAYHQGLSLGQLSEMTGYTREHLSRIKHGRWPITEQFVARIVLRLGDWAREMFYDEDEEQDVK